MVERNLNRDSDRNVGEKMKDNWDQFRLKVKDKWNDLTDNDLDTYKGRRRDDLVGHISERTGARREEISRDIDSLSQETGYRFGP